MKSLLVFVTLAITTLAAPTGPIAISQGQQGASGNGGLVGAGVNAIANVAAKVADVDVECNDILDNSLNNANVNVLRRGAPIAGTQAQQGASGTGGLVGAGVNGVVNAAVTGVKAVVDNNNILDYSLNNANVDILRRGAPVAGTQAQQGASGTGGLVGAGVNGIVNAAVTGVKAVVDNNNILDDSLNNLNVDVLRRSGPVAGTQAAQGATGTGGLVGAGVNAVVNAAATLVDAKVDNNNVGNDSLNNLKVGVLSRRGGPVAGTQAQQGASGNGGLVGAGVNAAVNAAVTGVKAVVDNNNILDDSLNNLNVDVLRRRGGPVAGTQAYQGANGVGGLVGAGVNAVVNAAVKGVDADISNNNILDDSLNNLNVDVLRRHGGPVAGTQAAQGATGNGGLVGAGVNAVVNAAAKVVDLTVDNNNIGDYTLNNANVDVL